MKIQQILFFTIAKGEKYELMANNLFGSIKKYHKKAVTAIISNNKVDESDIHIKIGDICKTGDINDFCIRGQSYSWKLGLTKTLPKDFKKFVFFDCDSECVAPMDIYDSPIREKFYSAWCQRITTKNKDISEKINKKWYWSGASFEALQDFAKKFRINEWCNVNGGLFTIHSDCVEKYIERYYYWADSITTFLQEYHGYNLDKNNAWGTEEITFSLMQAEVDPEYKTADISSNKIGQLCMDSSITDVRKNKQYIYSPWFSTINNTKLVKATTVHFPGAKEELEKNNQHMHS